MSLHRFQACVGSFRLIVYAVGLSLTPDHCTPKLHLAFQAWKKCLQWKTTFLSAGKRQLMLASQASEHNKIFQVGYAKTSCRRYIITGGWKSYNQEELGKIKTVRLWKNWRALLWFKVSLIRHPPPYLNWECWAGTGSFLMIPEKCQFHTTRYSWRIPEGVFRGLSVSRYSRMWSGMSYVPSKAGCKFNSVR